MSDTYDPEKMAKFLEGITEFAKGGPKAMKAKTASRHKKHVSGAADSGESRDGGTRAVSFSDPLRKTKSGLNKDRLHRALCSGLAYAPDPEIMAMAKEISVVCGVARNAEFLAWGFVVAVEYYRTRRALPPSTGEKLQ